MKSHEIAHQAPARNLTDCRLRSQSLVGLSSPPHPQLVLSDVAAAENESIHGGPSYGRVAFLKNRYQVWRKQGAGEPAGQILLEPVAEGHFAAEGSFSFSCWE